MSHLYINQIQPGQMLNDTYMVTQPVLRNTTRGDLYIAMYLSDSTGKVNSRMWQATEQIYNSIPKEGFIKIQGKAELYQNNLQIVINGLTVIDPDDVNLADYMPRTEKDVGKMFTELKDMLEKIQNPGLRKLIASFLSDKELMRQFCTAPAAMQMHHSYLGGLLEHTHNMLRVALAILPLYPRVQGDLVLVAIFLHDLAKTQELSYKMGFSYTAQGQLVGHIVQGTLMINDRIKAENITIDQDVLDSLLHIIVSHHGRYDFGSPKLPATAEAFMVNYIDDLDAKMNQVGNLIDNEPGDDDWTNYQRSLETRIYRKRPLSE